MISHATRFRWFHAESDMTIDDILALKNDFRPDSLVAAICDILSENAAISGTKSLSAEERTVLCVEQMRSEVDNGGYYDFFYNATAEMLDDLLPALEKIGCHRAVTNAAQALSAVGAVLPLDDKNLDVLLECENPQRDACLAACDSEFHGLSSAIETALFAYIVENRRHITSV